MISKQRLMEIMAEDAEYPITENDWISWSGLMRAVEREARREALEEAAKVCDSLDGKMGGPKCGCNECCAAEIRELFDDERVQPEDCTCVGFHTNCKGD